MIKALIFDCWGTLFTNSQHPHPFAVFANAIGRSISDRAFLKVFERHMMTNDKPVPEHITALLAELKIDTTPQLIQKLTDIILGSLPTQLAYSDTLHGLDTLKKNYRLILLSNTFEEGFASLQNKYAINDWFELMLLSYEEHTIKPDGVFYKKILDMSGLGKNEVLMIGDNYHDDVMAARSVGIQAVLLDRRRRHPEVLTHKVHDLTGLDAYLRQNNNLLN